MNDSDSPARAKRQKVDRTGRLSALEKLRQLKGSKHKYEVDELENVYEEVDEREYSKTVIGRQTDDWIVDDGESGYVEDGREIFDDDLDEESIQQAKKHNMAGPRKKKKDEVKKKGNIQSMIMGMPSKKKPNERLEDDILGDLMSELKKEEPARKSESRGTRNKFRTTPKNNTSMKEERQSTSSSQHIEDDDGDDDKVIFDKPKQKTSTDHLSISKINIETASNNRPTTSQDIIDDENSSDLQSEQTSSIKNTENDSEKKAVENEHENEDLSQFAADLISADFNSGATKMDTTPPVPVASTVKPKVVAETPMCKEIETEFLNPENFNEVWDMVCTKQDSVARAPTDCSEIPMPLTTNENGEEVFRFYWWDAYEDAFKQPGVVYIFGKVYVPSLKAYHSCCITVKNIPRRIFLLPRESTDTMEEVYKEFNEFANRSGIKEFRCSTVQKQYAFEQEGTPRESEYLEVRYSANYPALPGDYSGPCIERVFGTTINALELLLIERKIKGPCWLDIKSPLPTGVQTSWCKVKVNCMKMENISVCTDTQSLSLPPLVVATLNVRASLNTRTQQNEVTMVAMLLHNKYHTDKEPPKPPFQQHFCLITNPRDTPWPRGTREALPKITYTKVIKCDTEVDLLEELLKILNEEDPDLLIGYDCGFQFDILMHRMFTLKVSHWSRLGRLKRSTPPVIRGKAILGQALAGRPICDIQVSAKELNLKVRSYDLQSLCMAVLRKKENECKEIKPGETSSFYSSTSKIENLIQITLMEALHIMKIVFELNVIPLALQITCIAGNIISRTLTAGRAERNEYLLLHAFHAKNYVTPDRRVFKRGKDDSEVAEQSRRKKAAYAGGLVLDPKKGFYDKLILLMDFNSLYPSIIQEYNLCFTTVPGAAYADTKDLALPEPNLEPGVVPTEIRKLVESRVEVKKLMKAPNLTPELKMQYNIRQMALKLTANSMYGCLGATHCRFYAKGLAALITAKGREILQNTKNLVEKLNYEVIYGDTDSIMINTNILDFDEVFSVGKRIKQEVNKLYKRVELDIDGVFRYLLLLQKKKYAAVTMTKLPNGQIELAQEHKGLDIVRRDWCQLACDIGRKILDQLLSDQSNENRLEQIFNILQTVAKNVRDNQVSLSSLVITKQLSKNPNEYPDKKQTHVQVALRLNKEGGRMWKAGDTVPYIICEDGTDRSATERAYHIDEYKKSNTLKIDVNYYLLSQIFPIVLRICDPIEGIDDVLLAENLGLQGVYKSKRTIHEEDDLNVPLLVNEDRFKYCLPLKFKCRNPACGVENVVNEVLTETPAGQKFSLASCVNPDCNVAPWTYYRSIQNEMQMTLRDAISEYYDAWLECENPLCGHKTRILPLDFRKKYPTCRQCEDTDMHKVYSDTKLYNQICFYLHLFDIQQPAYKNLLPQHPQGLRSAYEMLKEAVERKLKRNAYSVVDLSTIFASVNMRNETVPFSFEGLEVSDGSEDEMIVPTNKQAE